MNIWRVYQYSLITLNRILSIIIIGFALVSCVPSEQNLQAPLLTQTANALWSNPVPLPQFVRHIEIWKSAIDTRLCTQLNIFAIWESGDYDHDTYASIDRTLRIEVDGSLLDKSKLSFATLGIALTRTDDKGNVVGSQGGDMSICFYVDDLQDGMHQEAIYFQSTSGKSYEYEWAFRKFEQDKKTTIDLPTSLQ